MRTKTCKGCSVEQPIDNFYSNGFSPNGTQKYKAYCGPCWNKRTRAGREVKILEVLKELDIPLECEICGYNKNWAALAFHHLDGEDKDFGISTVSNTTSAETLKNEIMKCVLLCANCHAEEHYPHLEIVVDDYEIG